MGGGTLCIPGGTYATGTIQLKSNITLYLAPGAVLKGSENIADYRYNGFYHNEFKEPLSLIYAIDEENIKITGEGVIDFSAEAFMFMDKLNTDWLNCPYEQMTEEEKAESPVRASARPNQPIFFHNCKRIVVENIKLTNSPCWTVTFSCSQDIKVKGITVDNSLIVPNCDGFHFSASKDILVDGCVISCADDCIAITCITDTEEISERVVISNCTMRTRSAAVRLGHLYSKVRNVIVSNLVIYESNRAISIFSGDNGWVENVKFSNITADTRMFAGAWWGRGELLVMATDETGYIKDISFDNITGKCANGMILSANNKQISNIAIRNTDVNLVYSDKREKLGKVLDLAPFPVRPMPEGHMPWLYAESINNLSLVNVNHGAEFDGYDNSEMIIE